MPQGLSVAVLGATGAVGHEFLKLFEDREFPVRDLRLLASERSAGKKLRFKGQEHTVQSVTPESFQGVDVAFFSAGAGRSREFAPHAVEAGAVVVDNSSAFRMNDDTPLVVPEINADTIGEAKVIAVPNCTAIILLMATAPLFKLGKVSRIVVSTYQSASGAGAAAMEELQEQTRDVLEGREAVPKVMPHKYAFNVFSHNTTINEHGYNDEEWKVIHESRKIMRLPDLRIGVTCVRVPVLRAHSESITVEFDGSAPSEQAVIDALAAAPGVRVVDDREGNVFPMPLDASGQYDVLVGRVRKDVSHPSAISLFASGDQLLKGAALNGVQIAEKLIELGRLKVPASV